MDDVTRVAFAKALCNSDLPQDVYPHYVKFFDLLCEKWRMLLGNPAPPRNDRALVAAIADALKERDEYAAALEVRIGILESMPVAQSVGEPENATIVVGQTSIPATATVTMPMCDADVAPLRLPLRQGALPNPKIDMRTRAGRKLKRQQVEPAGV